MELVEVNKTKDARQVTPGRVHHKENQTKARQGGERPAGVHAWAEEASGGGLVGLNPERKGDPGRGLAWKEEEAGGLGERMGGRGCRDHALT